MQFLMFSCSHCLLNHFIKQKRKLIETKLHKKKGLNFNFKDRLINYYRIIHVYI